jgi:ATP synthase protein I
MALFGPEQRKQLRIANRVSAVGAELAIATLLGLFGGSWIDGRFGTRPIFTFLGLALGLAAGMKGLYRLVRAERRKTAKTPAKPSPDAPKDREPPR